MSVERGGWTRWRLGRGRPRHALAALALVALAAGLVVTTRPAAAAVARDLVLTKTSYPASARAGNMVLYRVDVANAGSSQAFNQVRVTDTLAAGTTFVASQSSSWCAPAGGTVVCDVPGPVNPGQSVSFDVVVATTTATPTVPCGPSACITNVAEITSSTPRDPFPNNNRDPAQTVLTTAPTNSAGFLPPGATTAASSRSGRPGVYVLNEPASANGVVFNLTAADPTPFCGSACLYEDAVIADFEPALADRQVTDPQNPLVLNVRMGPRTPCRGIGGDDPCFNIRYIKPGMTVGAILPFCTGAGPGSSRGPGIASPSPCKNHQFKSPTGEINFEILLLSTDPGFY